MIHTRAIRFAPHVRRSKVLCCGWAVTVSLLLLCPAEELHGQSTLQNRPPEIPRIANEPPDANAIMMMQQRRHHDLQFDAANAERKRRMTEEAALLLRLAGEVKQEVDHSDQAAMRITYRKTELIERLARDVQDKMKLTVGAK